MHLLAAILFISAVSARPADHDPVEAAITALAVQIDNQQLNDAPVLKLGPTKMKGTQIVGEGESLTLRCEFTSSPMAVIHWVREGKVVQGDKRLNVMEKMLNAGKTIVEMGITTSFFTIPCATQADAGTYKCVGFNGHQTVEGVTEVTVTEGTGAPCKTSLHTGPSITQFSDSRFEMEGNFATLICRTDKPATIQWDYEGEELKVEEEPEKFEITQDGSLIVKNLHWDDMGTYGCRASNKYGEDRAECFLYPSKKKETH